ncbi:hypothetical protein C7999DRAFT_17186 [Corynascus novoguineensis]|uniref:Bul1 C-terminal domain-containing protein n=1 Tax=Corynascus novoguineensis TaxID=1126955 RepID=A0AAN7CLW8_9PEZI|nr:hypothetical protein C7999DRAFT_17186 [Corynascus novoguineensis]
MGPWMHVASSASSVSSPSSAFNNAQRAAYPKSDINIHLKNHSNSKVYTSMSPVVGDLTITTKRDVRFDSIEILLLGHTKTTLEGMGMPQEVTHTFLKMVMPIPESAYPLPRVLEPGRTLTLPFNFVIPSQLTINACNHARLVEAMQDYHVKLPPSVGAWERDDMAPKMTRVVYQIKARVVRDDDGRKTRIMETTQPIQVLPATPEEPPLSITDKDRLYRLSKAKNLRKNFLTTKIGCIRAEALQPSAAILSSDGRRVMSHPMVRIKLVFQPGSPRALPPTVTGVTAKLTAHTYFSSSTIQSFPNLGDWQGIPGTIDRRGQYSTSVALPAVTLAEQPAWTSHPSLARRDSGYGSSVGSCVEEEEDYDETSSDNDEPMKRTAVSSSSLLSSSTATTSHHTATLAVPLSLPTDKKTFVPTFHSCIVSRVYTVTLTVALAGKGGGSTSLSVVVPLQVAVDAAPVATAPTADRPPSFEEAAADEHLRPRVLQAPPEELTAREGRASWMLATAGAGAVATATEAHESARVDELPEYAQSGWRRRV